MNAKQFIEVFAKHFKLDELRNAMEQSQTHLSLQGIAGSALPLIAGWYFNQSNESQLIITNDEEEANYLKTDVLGFFSFPVYVLPESFKKPFQTESTDNDKILQRAEILSQIRQKDHKQFIISWPQAICEKVLDKDSLNKNTFFIEVGNAFDLDFFMELLVTYDFDRVDFVVQPGEYSIRGGIIDVFSFGNEYPYRVELDAETIESIREFDPETQLSVKKVKTANILPNLQSDSLDAYKVSIFDYFNKDLTVWIKDYDNLKNTILQGEKLAEEAALQNNSSNDFSQFFDTWHETQKRLNKKQLLFYGGNSSKTKSTALHFNQSYQPDFNKNFKLISDNLFELQQKKYHTFIFSDSAKQIERLYSIFSDINPELNFEPVYKELSIGFIDHDLKIACYTDHQLFDRYYRYKSRNKFSATSALTLKDLSELRPGDFVVHMDHGIGKFAGLEKLNINGVVQEAVRLVYRNNDLLYVSISSLHKISKYVGKDGTEPSMHKLGSDTWEKLKSNTKKKVKDIARDLIKLYASRKAQQGFQFSPDNYLQVELEASFIYEDTPDQSKASEQVKADMCKANPMDRLVCGDVGFGKTEVAIRAAFKAVCDSKQVAVLVPTTILAQQHYKTFNNRLKEFPCNIDYINRFRSKKEQTQILKRLEEGNLDIIIGTHKLVSKETKFKDLGLLIIDEEQKFGVAVKEKLKQFKVNVDTLTLTATPIPRTLHFSLMGARDLSVINTPPSNRQPVKTELHVFNKELIRMAVENELNRGGQVFFIHHRVKDINEIANMIKDCVPEARIAVAHGQMPGEELEDVMIKFIEAEFDVLVATTIIESGLDIPNANTIIINNAHMFGLSDLHQMRGRVGRSNRKAFCYLFSPPLSTLTQEARKRLSAIEQFSELGSGFNVAMRDLDIRGAGNLLGAEQSGFIAEIGFDLYQKILNEAIQELKHDEFSDIFADEQDTEMHKTDCQVDADFEMLIPDSYVRNIAERLLLYKELSAIATENDLEKFSEKLKDRFGTLPKQVKVLLETVKLKWLASDHGFEKIAIAGNELTVFFPSNQESNYYKTALFGNLLKYIASKPNRVKLKQSSKNLSAKFSQIKDINAALELLNEIKNSCLSQD